MREVCYSAEKMKTLLFSLLGLLLLTGCQTQTTIVNNIPERDANEIVVLLVSRGIPAQKVAAPAATTAAATAEKMWDITVPGDKITEALAILNHSGLPRTRGTSLLDLFGSQGLVPSDLQDQIRYQEGLSEQLASTIRKMDGVLDANVQITFPRDEESTHQLTASVYIKHRGLLDNQNSLIINKVKRLVASALPGLTTDNVTVVADRASLAEITLPSLGQLEQEREYIAIWGIAVARQSAFLFRFIFYLLLVLLFLLAGAIVWTLWKFSEVFPQLGVRGFFDPRPFSTDQLQAPPVAKEGEEQ